jgi:hypothetical protein
MPNMCDFIRSQLHEQHLVRDWEQVYPETSLDRKIKEATNHVLLRIPPLISFRESLKRVKI